MLMAAYLLDAVSRSAKPLSEASLTQFASRHQPVEVFLSFQRNLRQHVCWNWRNLCQELQAQQPLKFDLVKHDIFWHVPE